MSWKLYFGVILTGEDCNVCKKTYATAQAKKGPHELGVVCSSGQCRATVATKAAALPDRLPARELVCQLRALCEQSGYDVMKDQQLGGGFDEGSGQDVPPYLRIEIGLVSAEEAVGWRAPQPA